MNIPERLRTVPQNIYVIAFLGIFAICAFLAYFTREDTFLLERKIESRQKDYAEILQLRDIYEAKKHAAEKAGAGRVEKRPVTLASVEELVGKSFTGGALSTLHPVAEKGEKGAQQAVEIKVTNAPLGEIISFVKNAEGFGFYVGRLRLSLSSANTGALDVQATVMEKRSSG
jgi:hypothetical protein